MAERIFKNEKKMANHGRRQLPGDFADGLVVSGK